MHEAGATPQQRGPAAAAGGSFPWRTQHGARSKGGAATTADLLAIPEGERFHEIIDGELVRKSMARVRHGRSQARLTIRIGGPYDRRPGGRWPGGWRFATETEIVFEDHESYRPDVAGLAA